MRRLMLAGANNREMRQMFGNRSSKKFIQMLHFGQFLMYSSCVLSFYVTYKAYYNISMISYKPSAEVLKDGSIDTWQKILNHEFIVEIAKDILPISKFAFYIKQDQISLNYISHMKRTSVYNDDICILVSVMAPCP
jgi:hypothetical protein